MIDKTTVTENAEEELDFPEEEEFTETLVERSDQAKPVKKILITIIILIFLGLIGFEAYRLLAGTKFNMASLSPFKNKKTDNLSAVTDKLKELSKEHLSDEELHPTSIQSEHTPQKPVPFTPIMPEAVPTAPTTTTPETPAKSANFDEIKDLFSKSEHVPENSIQKESDSLTKTQTSLQDALHQTEKANHQSAKIEAEILSQAQTQSQTNTQIQQLAQTLERLNRQIENNSDQVNRLESSINNISRTISKVSGDVNSMDSRILGLTNTANALSNDLGNVKRALNDDGIDIISATPPLPSMHKPKVHGATENATSTQNAAKPTDSKTLTYQAPEYVVHAVIPGRAWLKSNKGKILTVSEGDTVGDYGKVLVIDAANGIVLTSSGVSFR